MEAVTPSSSRKNEEEEYPRFKNMIILGSKPSKSDYDTNLTDGFKQNNDSDVSSDENYSIEENSRKYEVCKPSKSDFDTNLTDGFKQNNDSDESSDEDNSIEENSRKYEVCKPSKYDFDTNVTDGFKQNNDSDESSEEDDSIVENSKKSEVCKPSKYDFDTNLTDGFKQNNDSDESSDEDNSIEENSRKYEVCKPSKYDFDTNVTDGFKQNNDSDESSEEDDSIVENSKKSEVLKPSKSDFDTNLTDGFKGNNDSDESSDEDNSIEENSGKFEVCKPIKSDFDTNITDSFKRNNDNDESSDENNSIEANSGKSEVCKHCNRIYPDRELLLNHLLEIANKCSDNDKKSAKKRSYHDSTTEIVPVDENTPLDPANPLKRRKKYRSLENGEEITPKSAGIDQICLNITSDNEALERRKKYRSSENGEEIAFKSAGSDQICLNITSADTESNKKGSNGNIEDVNFEEKQYFYKCRKCNEDLADLSAAHVHKLVEHPLSKLRHLFFKCYVQESESAIESNDDEEQVKCKKYTVTNKSSQNNLKIKLSHKDSAYKRLTSNETYDDGPGVIEMTTNEDNSKEKVAKLFRCLCGLHYTSHNALQKHFKTCSPQYKVSRQNCSKCGILFPTDSLVDHLCKHHSNDKYKFEVFNMTPDVKAYDCEFCHITFYSSDDLNKHVEECKFDSNPRDSIASEDEPKPKRHRCSVDSTNKTNLTTNDSKKKNIDKPSNTFQKGPTFANRYKTQQQYTVYKCYKCEVHYLTLSTIRHHFEVNNHLICVKVMPCTFCGLNFTNTSMKRHVHLHHTKIRCELKDLNVQIINESTNFSKPDELVSDNAENLTDDTCPKPEEKDVPKSGVKKSTTAVNSSTPDTQQLKNNYGEKLYKSSVCPIHFMTKRALFKHMRSDHISMELCTQSSTNCTICGHIFGVGTLPDHIIVHHFDKKLKAEDLRITIINDSVETHTHVVTIANNAEDNSKSLKLKPKIDDGNIKKKGASQNSPSNVPKVLNFKSYSKRLYKCEKCFVHLMKLNTLHKHQPDCNPRVSVADSCKICGLSFNSCSMKRHIYVHHKKMKLKREDFIIQQLNETLKEGTKPTRNTEKKASKTILQGDSHSSQTRRTYKLSAENKAILDMKSYDKRLYKCDKCSLHFMKYLTLWNHSRNSYPNCKPHDETNKVCCEYCGLKFSFISVSVHEYAHHERMKYTLKDFKIITIKKKDSNKTITGRQRKYQNVSEHGLDTQVKEKIGRPRKPLTQTNPKLFFNSKDGKNDNINDGKRKRGRPRKPLTQTNPKLFIKSKDGKNDNINDGKRKRGRPRKLLTQTNPKLFIYSKDGKNDNINYDETKNRRFKHRCTKKVTASTKRVIAAKNYTSNDNCLYRCNICSLHFMSEITLYRHLQLSKSDHNLGVNTVKCSECDLSFKKISLSRHKSVHHTKLKLTHQDFSIISKPIKETSKTLQSNESVTDFKFYVERNKQLDGKDERFDKTDSDLSISDNNFLYKCHTCFLHFVGARTYYQHVAKGDHAVLDAKCGMCGLFFSLNSIERHKEIHHSILKLKREDIRIVNQIKVSDDKTVLHNNGKSFITNIDAIDRSLKTSVTATKTNYTTRVQDLHIKDMTHKNYIESSRNKIKMALESIESSSYDINALRENVAGMSKTKKPKIDDNETTAELNNTPTDTISLEEDEDASVSITDPSRHLIELPIVFTEPPENKVVSSINKRKYTKNHIQTCNVDNTPRTMISFEDDEFLNNDNEQLGQDMETTREFTESLDISDSSDEETIDVSNGKPGVASQRNIVLSSTSNMNTTKQNTNRVENATNAERSNNLQFLSSMCRRNNLQSILHAYSENLYRCEICCLYFISSTSFKSHMNRAIHDPRRTEVCEICNYTFSSKSMNIHKDIHHTLLKLKREDFKVPSYHHTASRDKLKKAMKTIEKGKVSADNKPKKKTSSAEKEGNGNKSPNNTTITDSKYQVTLYKCGVCNVYFVKRSIWLKHTTDHVSFQHKEYMECKLCGFQFANHTLHKHVEKHHETDFELEDVLVKEYMNDGTIETYCALDRVQSKLVSTTTEVVKTIVASDFFTEGLEGNAYNSSHFKHN